MKNRTMAWSALGATAIVTAGWAVAHDAPAAAGMQPAETSVSLARQDAAPAAAGPAIAARQGSPWRYMGSQPEKATAGAAGPAQPSGPAIPSEKRVTRYAQPAVIALPDQSSGRARPAYESSGRARPYDTDAIAVRRYSDPGWNVFQCNSEGHAYQRCPAGLSRGQRVILDRQFSGAPCREGRDWGLEGDAIWVDNGCRAQFAIER